MGYTNIVTSPADTYRANILHALPYALTKVSGSTPSVATWDSTTQHYEFNAPFLADVYSNNSGYINYVSQNFYYLGSSGNASTGIAAMWLQDKITNQVYILVSGTQTGNLTAASLTLTADGQLATLAIPDLPNTPLANAESFVQGVVQTYLGSRDLRLPMHEGLRGDGRTYASAELLSIISEVSVVRLPDQVFGAAAVSGRLFKDFADDCGEAVRCLTSGGTPVPEALGRLSRRLKDYLEYYEAVCRHEGVELPYIEDA